MRTATVIATAGQGVESTMLATVEEVFHVGLQDAPLVASSGDAITVTARGVRVELHGASVHT